ncbi:MAG TPA: flagellar protein export ATPase FliI [Candidatus Latescibacteria bacterium]|nr:flagellar protein export ATPase FliI [Candidatus Latescibacterota bacterium]
MNKGTVDYKRYLKAIDMTETIRLSGKVSKVVGLIIESSGPAASVGDLCYVEHVHRPAKWVEYRREPKTHDGGHGANGSSCMTPCEVVGFKDNKVLLMPLGDIEGICPGSAVTASGEPLSVAVGNELLGRVLDGLGRPIDEKGPLEVTGRRPVHGSPPDPLSRRRIKEPLGTGIRAIDALLTCGKGQRVGIFSGSGVGKSVLLGMIAKSSEADVNVIALIGERGREVREFIERDLGEEGLERSVVVAVTSDKPALIRIKGAMVATSIAEHFRDLGMDVMLMMDSLTRVAVAQREIGLSIGEPPTTRGYTPSVFAMLPKLLERAGNSSMGSITGLYTVLVEGDDVNEPISDAVRAILDGHIVLSRRLASLNHYPAIDVLNSVSRVMIDVVSEEHRRAANRLKGVLATYKEAEDLINIGAYVKGSNPKIDYAIEHIEKIKNFLKQGIDEKVDFRQSVEMMIGLLEKETDSEEIQLQAAEDNGVQTA